MNKKSTLILPQGGQTFYFVIALKSKNKGSAERSILLYFNIILVATLGLVPIEMLVFLNNLDIFLLFTSLDSWKLEAPETKSGVGTNRWLKIDHHILQRKLMTHPSGLDEEIITYFTSFDECVTKFCKMGDSLF
jgi:hypothetical protein